MSYTRLSFFISIERHCEEPEETFGKQNVIATKHSHSAQRHCEQAKHLIQQNVIASKAKQSPK